MDRVSLARLRAHVVAAQGYATRRRRASVDDVARAVGRLSCVQLDSISAVERAHRITLTSRTGVYPRGAVTTLLGAGRIFEYWAHEASLLPIDAYPLVRTDMAGSARWGVYERALREHGDLVPRVLARVREEGPLGARHFDGAGTGMWGWKPAKMVLEALWDRGELAIAGRPGFQRLYDLPERVIPDEWLGAAAPGEAQRVRELVLRAVRGRGALTEAGIVEHWRLKGGVARIRPAVDALVGEGYLRPLQPDDGGSRVLVPADAELDTSAGTAAVLLSPFDNLVWDRAWLERLFSFRHVIEVFKRAHERVYGYYVLPFLLGDRLVGRADLKSERREGVLRVHALHLEPGVRRSRRLEEAFERALARLAQAAGLKAIEHL